MCCLTFRPAPCHVITRFERSVCVRSKSDLLMPHLAPLTVRPARFLHELTRFSGWDPVENKMFAVLSPSGLLFGKHGSPAKAPSIPYPERRPSRLRSPCAPTPACGVPGTQSWACQIKPMFGQPWEWRCNLEDDCEVRGGMLLILCNQPFNTHYHPSHDAMFGHASMWPQGWVEQLSPY